MGKIITTNVVSEVQITKDDLIAIAVSKYEQNLLTKEKELVNRKKIVSDELAAVSSDIDAAALSQAKSAGFTGFDNVVKSLEACGYSIKTETFMSSLTVEELKYDITIKENTKNKYVNPDVHIHRSGTLTPNPQIVSLLEKKESLEKELSTIQTQRMEAKKALGNLTTVERSAKANLAKSVLLKSEEGRALLSQMDDLEDAGAIKLLSAD